MHTKVHNAMHNIFVANYNVNVWGYRLFETSTIHADGNYNSLCLCRISSEVIHGSCCRGGEMGGEGG